MKLLWELQVFCAVVERKSFVSAARQLGTSPSTATRAVQALEESLGSSLLARSQNRSA
jgi:DNA-binding transcriptional LysR family regulator